MASYFSYIPNIYVAEGSKDDEAYKYRLVKNLFRRVSVKSKILEYITLTEAYYIQPFDTPALLAQEFYGSTTYDWAILITNNIVDSYTQWPKMETDLLAYIKEKYNEPDAIHHYETLEVKYEDEIVVPANIEVNESYRATLPNGNQLSSLESRVAVTNYEHETYLNELKKFIKMPTPQVVNFMEQEFIDLLGYENCPELDDAGNKKTTLSIVSRFLNSAGYVGVGATVNQIQEASAADIAKSAAVATANAAAVATSTTTTTSTTSASTSTTTTQQTSTTSTSTSSTSSSSSSSTSSSSSSSSSSGSSSGYGY